jgi:hypothetical protein
LPHHWPWRLRPKHLQVLAGPTQTVIEMSSAPSSGWARVSGRVGLFSDPTENTTERQLRDCTIRHRAQDVPGQVYAKASAA